MKKQLGTLFLVSVIDILGFGILIPLVPYMADRFGASPEDAASWIAEKRELIADAEFRALYLDHDAAYDWSPDDPRLPGLAERTRNWFSGRSEARPVKNPAIARLAQQSLPGTSSPAWDRLAELMKG